MKSSLKFLLHIVFALCIGLVINSSCHAQIPKKTTFRGMTYSGTSSADLQDLRALGANLVAYQIIWPGVAADTATESEYKAWLDSQLATIDSHLITCQSIGMKMLLILHTPPGGFETRVAPARHRLFSEEWAQRTLIETWQKLAARYGTNPSIYGFDILNEPAQQDVTRGLLTWTQLAPVLTKTIRDAGSKALVVVEPIYGNPDMFKKLKKLSDKNVSYSFHSYFPSNFRNQGFNGRPINVSYPKGKLNREALLKSVSKALAFQRKNNVRVFVGEFAAPRWAPGKSTTNFLRDYINIFEKFGWDWGYHAWREADAWSVEHTNDPNNHQVSPTVTDRELLMIKYFGRNKHSF